MTAKGTIENKDAFLKPLFNIPRYMVVEVIS